MIENIKFVLKRYRSFIIALIILMLVIIIKEDKGMKAYISATDSFMQMLYVLPPIMLLLGLMDEWISRESMMKYMGDDSRFLGVILAIALAAFAAGPMYAAFPFTAVLLKKGVKFSNIIIFMNSWCVIKISTLLFEVSALGYKFTLYRLLIDIVGVILMGYLVDYSVNKLPKTSI